MTIRARLALSISLLLILSMGALSYGVFLIQAGLSRRDAERRVDVIASSARRSAEDALLQKDDVLLVSYLNFLRQQDQSLVAVRVEWPRGPAAAPLPPRVIEIGSTAGRSNLISRTLAAADPGDPSRRVILTLDIDRTTLYGIALGGQNRLGKVLLLAAGLTLSLGIVFAFWFAGSVTRPLRSLVDLATQISGGKLGVRFEWSSKDEVGDLVKALNGMSQKLEELDESKKNFVSSVTHELRSPLGAIESFLHLLESKLPGADRDGARESAEYLHRIKVNVQRLGSFINDLLDVAKIEKGKMECVLRPVRLQEITDDVCKFFEPKARLQGVSVSHRLDSLPAVSADPDRVRQVLVNLLSNALKFTPSGGSVTISGEAQTEGGERWAEIRVRDTGRGMDAEDAGRLFAAFSQGRNVSQGVIGTKGTGLGLFIVKNIVEQHGGVVTVTSKPGEGTEIKFSLRLAQETNGH